jgi:hypothetical protein
VRYARAVSQRCCPRCRLLQRERRCVDCGADTAVLADLTRLQIAGLTRVPKPPPTGWRDQVALWTTAFGIFGAAIAGGLITQSALGVLAGPAFGLLGYRKQFWKAAFKRRPRLAAVTARERPPGAWLVGAAQPFERTLTGGALAIATTIENRDGVIVRAIDAAAFWLVADRRILIVGHCWVTGASNPSLVPASILLRQLDAGGFPLSRASRVGLRVTRVAIAPGERIAVVGQLREETIAGLGGYRDAMTETLRGEPGAPVWIERLAQSASLPADEL